MPVSDSLSDVMKCISSSSVEFDSLSKFFVLSIAFWNSLGMSESP